MIRRYDSGAAFLAENRAFLDTKPQISAFMALDAPLLEKTDKINYVARCEKDGKTLLAMKVEPYHLQLFGDAGLRGGAAGFFGARGIRNPKLSERKDAGRRGGARDGSAVRHSIRRGAGDGVHGGENPHRAVVARRLKRRMKTIWTKSMRAWSDFWSNATCRTSRTARR